MKASHVFGTITIVAIIGGTVYAIKKSIDAKKVEGEEISLSEARAIVAERKFDKAYSEQFDDDNTPVEYVNKDIKATLKFQRDIIARPYNGDEYEEEEDDEEIEDDIPIEIEYGDSSVPFSKTITEDDRILRYEPNSIDALNQFNRMELAEWGTNEDAYQTMERLFEFPFQPQNDGDDMLRTQIIDYRVQFFGFSSKWSKQVSYADVILHYARAAHFNCDETIKYWVEYFLDFNDLYHAYSSNTIDETLRALNSHTYFNEERTTFGLFGLTRQSMDQAIRIANRNIDRSVTYEIEFNEFLKSFI